MLLSISIPEKLVSSLKPWYSLSYTRSYTRLYVKVYTLQRCERFWWTRTHLHSTHIQNHATHTPPNIDVYSVNTIHYMYFNSDTIAEIVINHGKLLKISNISYWEFSVVSCLFNMRRYFTQRYTLYSSLPKRNPWMSLLILTL